MLTTPLRAAGDPAAAALERYAAAQERSQPWTLETVDIDASLPKLAKTGRLRAIRRLLPAGKPEYEVIETTGDRTVKQQVIVRYLSQDARAATMPYSAFAINATNYKFRYAGVTRLGDTTAYIFQITPRHKREGLIRGELWLDENGVPLKQSGYLVKRPSIFIKRVDVTRETDLRDGVIAMRTTHLSLDTRLVGRAELTIQERPAEEER